MPYPSRGRSHNRGRGSGRRGQPRPQRETSNPTTTSSSSSTTATPNLAALFTSLVSVLQQFVSTPQGDSSSSSGGTGASGGGYPKPPQQRNRRHPPANPAPPIPSLMDFPPLARPQGMGGGTKIPRPRPQETSGRAAGINVPQQEGRSEKMSENPDFKDLVRRTNLGARLQNAKSNWQKLPSTLNAAIDRLTQSIKPPAPTESLSQKLSRAAENFKSNIRHIVEEHLVTQYGSNQRALAQLDATDRDHATLIARKQLTKSNGRINNTRAEELLHIQYVDEMEIRDGWRQAQSKKRALPRTPSPQTLQISVPVEVHNRFQPLSEDQLEPDQALELLEQTMSDPENPTPVERQKSPPTETPRKKIVVAEEADFRVPPPPVRPALPASAAARPGSGLYALLRSASCSDITDAPTRSTTSVPATSGRASGPSSGNSDTTDTTTLPTTPMTTTSGTSGSTSGCPPSTPPTPLPSPSREPRIRLSLFPPGRRNAWSIPEIRDDEDTLILTDSNGGTLAEAAPSSWRIAAYRGARLEDIVNILDRFPLPAAIRTVVVMIGINDKIGFLEQPMVNSITRLYQLMIVKPNIRVAVSTVPFFDGEAPGQTSQIRVLNDFLEDILRDTKWLHRLPSDFTATRKNPRDFHHYDADTASRLVRLLDGFLQSSN